MAKFDAGTAVERLEYDFTAFGGGAGPIPEPSTGSVNSFFKNMKKLVKEVNALQATVKEVDLEEMDDEALVEAMSNMDEQEEGVSHLQTKTIEYLAILCGATRELVDNPEDPDGDKIEVVTGGSPSMQELNLLPYRVLQAFSQWFMGEIRPKRTTPGTRN